MRQAVLNVLLATALPVLAYLTVKEREGFASAQAALRDAQERAGVADEQARVAKEVEAKVAEYEAKVRADPKGDHRVKFPPLVERPRPGHVTFAELASMPKAITQPGFSDFPPALAERNGKTVTMTGFLIVAYAVEPITEVLLAKNPWDQCCLGEPPTLFDSVLVRLKPGTKLSRSRIGIVSLTGTFKIAPTYDFNPGKKREELGQLYLLEDAVEAEPLAARAGSGSGPAVAEPVSYEGYYVTAMPLVLLAAVINNLYPSRSRTADGGGEEPKLSPEPEPGAAKGKGRKITIND
jgi:hypothetical protein